MDGSHISLHIYSHMKSPDYILAAIVTVEGMSLMCFP
jgi:hypothetical protein